ncbi:Lar family restriction alleviation protein [Chitiniphilus purpureus]|uniref:Lar family restriction alleviation protein n=1 Tax=Chitiniphilus purpureus TaxID=2981137 RepID=A0ABY6DJ56_9NEIS|nr:Lar family restriction alleviation protein [Chitiniphilus sp. CD1]UXY14389.1 Lar family restriction alleviation protein [Chitiniphilus sp. CD1]
MTAPPDLTALAPQPCAKCGAPAEVIKSGSNRYWVQCAKFGRNGNCSAIGLQANSRKEAIRNWNSRH